MMAHPDALHWNRRYEQEKRAGFERPRPLLLEQLWRLPAHGLALDAAMGLGSNAGCLLTHGLKVVGVDVSDTALRLAKARFPALMAVQADLVQFYLPENTFDVILNFFYLERRIWPAYSRALKPGGILIFETLTQEMLSIHPDINPLYLLSSGELLHGFPELETLVYHEGWVENATQHPRAVASLVASKKIQT
jgi:SAM-dependent methyltransferase